MHSTMVTNLLNVYERSTTEDLREGQAFYPNATAQVNQWASTLRVSPKVVACVVSALSPNVDWPHNLVAACALLFDDDSFVYRGYRSNWDKAVRIYSALAEDITPYYPFGFKVRPFSLNLMGDCESVTVDTHALQAAHDDVLSRINGMRTIDVYSRYAEAYKQTSIVAGFVPCDFQSIIWHAWRRMYPSVYKRRVRTRR